MQLIYSNESSILAGNIKNLLELAGIEVLVKNEFASGAVGDLSAFDAWVELWVDDNKVTKAESIVKEAQNKLDTSDWFCPQCKEPNASSFDICWQCQHEKP